MEEIIHGLSKMKKIKELKDIEEDHRRKEKKNCLQVKEGGKKKMVTVRNKTSSSILISSFTPLQKRKGKDRRVVALKLSVKS